MSEPARAHILVVADDPATLRGLERTISDAGWSVQTAQDGPAALAICEHTPPTLALLNLSLAGLNGSELAATIARRWPDTAVIILSARDDVTKAAPYLRAGVDDHVVAPFDTAEVTIRAGRALERRRLIMESREHKRKLEARIQREGRAARNLFVGAMTSLSSALEAKDPYTRGHSTRVSRLARNIAHSIGLAPEELERVELAGRLHDIGKIGVKESILLKPGSLTEDEFLHIQTHPVVGERILAPVLTDVEVVAMVRNHHEHYEGGGYPDGLRGSAIPLGARILAVADAFDALTSDRPYRSRLARQAALDVLRAESGVQWQPALVEALIGYLEEGNRNNAGR